jgi:uncharacterized protein
MDLGAGQLVTFAIAKQLPGENHHMLIADAEVGIPAAIGHQHAGKLLGKFVGPVVCCLELDERPDRWHPWRLTADPDPGNPGQGQPVDVQLGANPDALADDGSCQHATASQRSRPDTASISLPAMGTETISLRAGIDELRLVDQHVHTVIPGSLTAAEFKNLLTESDQPAPEGTSEFDSQLGFAVRRWCGPVIGLDQPVTAEAYLERRNSVSAAAGLLAGAGCSHLLVDTGFAAAGSLALPELGALAGAAVREVVRLESVAEQVASSGCRAAEFGDAFAEELARRCGSAVAVKSIIAYRHGLNIDPAPPSKADVRAVAGRWLREIETRGTVRLTEPVLLWHLLWTATELRLPIQLHTGFGDPDLDLRRADPLLARDFLAGCGVPVVLLHCYPYHRQAGYLAHVYPNVYVDVGQTLNHIGARAPAVLAETLELAPFGKVLYSSDAYGLPELLYLGARLWRNAVAEVLGGWVATGQWTEQDAIRVAGMIGAGNSTRLYQLAEAAAI